MTVKPTTTVAQELRDQEMFLRDPATKWVRGVPRTENDACMVMRCGKPRRYGNVFQISLSGKAVSLLNALAPAEGCFTRITAWNDICAPSRDHVIAVLEEAADWAEEMGI